MTNPELQNPSAADRDHRILAALKFITPDVIAIRALPEDPEELEQLRVRIDTRILMGFGQSTCLSSDERAILSREADFSPALYGKFDTYLLTIAQQYGARLLLSSFVMQRLWSWQCGEKDGVQKLKNLFHEILHSAQTELGEATGQIIKPHKFAKPAFVKEITGLQMLLREEYPETAVKIRQFVNATIEGNPDQFPMLKSNKESLLVFLNDSRAFAFRGSDFKRTKGDLTPKRFYTQWVAAAANRSSEESVRQDISNL